MAKAMEPASDKNANFLASRRDSTKSQDDILNPEGLFVQDTEEALTAEFRFHLGMLDEEEDLSESFKASIGMMGPEAVAATTEIDMVWEKQYEATLKGFPYEKFARKNFKDKQTLNFSKEHIRGPLLAKRHDIDKLISPLIWLCIQRFMGDIPYPEVKPEKSRIPMMSRILQSLDINSKKQKSVYGRHGKPEEEIVSFKTGKSGSRGTVSEKRKTWRNLFSKSGSGSKRSSRVTLKSDEIVYPTDPDQSLEAIPSDELELIHYVVGHGILRREMRDEIFCQLCKQLKENPSKESSLQGWVLMALCIGCFLPSDQFINYLQSYLRAVKDDFKEYAMYTRRLIKRTTANGPRYHPPNWLEVQATKMRRFVDLPVALPDGRMQTVEADSAIIASEVCNKIAVETNLKDTYGFSLFICIFHKFMRAKGLRVEDAPWRLYFRKEIFVPWHNPEYCPVSTEFIYRQVCKGIRTEEYRTRSNGDEMIPGKLQAELKDYIPKRQLAGGRSRDGWMNAIIASFSAQGFDQKCVPPEQVKWHIVVTAPYKWPLQFSGVASVRCKASSGALCLSVFLRTDKKYGQVFTMVTLKGDEFSFISPNAHVIRDLVSTFLDGLRQRCDFSHQSIVRWGCISVST
ncbi:hypothetical protein LSH36_816g00081 [Paralvinella palmiformis]|uniref:MyTH4 domain-containing protein n=1 Tax=Paralvinella palmiformis TaxID=53620 RepID=A0AAD9MTY7_9ANNE|nr:hypothetical protein LSH36_816g00081 [Paralvinella palmiformis]